MLKNLSNLVAFGISRIAAHKLNFEIRIDSTDLYIIVSTTIRISIISILNTSIITHCIWKLSRTGKVPILSGLKPNAGFGSRNRMEKIIESNNCTADFGDRAIVGINDTVCLAFIVIEKVTE